MSKKQKLIEKICNKGQVSIDEIKTLLSGLGFAVRQSGSHVTFTKGKQALTIPAEKQVKPFYLGELCKILGGAGS